MRGGVIVLTSRMLGAKTRSDNTPSSQHHMPITTISVDHRVSARKNNCEGRDIDQLTDYMIKTQTLVRPVSGQKERKVNSGVPYSRNDKDMQIKRRNRG